MQFRISAEVTRHGNVFKWEGTASYSLDGKKQIVIEYEAWDEDTAVINGMEGLLEVCAEIAAQNAQTISYRGAKAIRAYRAAQANYMDWSGMVPEPHFELA